MVWLPGGESRQSGSKGQNREITQGWKKIFGHKKYAHNFDYDISFTSVSVQFSSVAQSCPTLCNPMYRSTPGLPVHHQLPTSVRLTSIESVMSASHLILCRSLLFLPQSLPASESFPMSQLFT